MASRRAILWARMVSTNLVGVQFGRGDNVGAEGVQKRVTGELFFAVHGGERYPRARVRMGFHAKYSGLLT
jgi:hypothetical protein